MNQTKFKTYWQLGIFNYMMLRVAGYGLRDKSFKVLVNGTH